MAQVVRLTIPWFFGEAVNALQAQGMEGITRARNDLLLMLAAVGVAWTMHGPARIVERFTALVVRERFADALHAKALALPVRWHEQHHSGDTLHRMTRATSSLASFAQSQFIYLQNTVSVVGPIAALFLISRATGAAAMAGYAAIGYFVVRIDAFMVLLVREENRAERRYNSALVDCLGNIATVLTLRVQEPMRRMLRSRLLAVFAPLRRNIVFNEVKWGGIDLLNGGMRTGLGALYAWLEFRQRGTISVGTAGGAPPHSPQGGAAGGGRVDRGGRNAPSAPQAPGRDLAAPAAGSCRLRVQRPRERDHGAAIRADRDRARLRAGWLHLGDRAAAAGIRYRHLRARPQSVGRTEAAARSGARVARGEGRGPGPAGRSDQQRRRVHRGRDLRSGDVRFRRCLHRLLGAPAAPTASIRHRDRDGGRPGPRHRHARRGQAAPSRALRAHGDGDHGQNAGGLIVETT